MGFSTQKEERQTKKNLQFIGDNALESRGLEYCEWMDVVNVFECWM